MKRLAAVVATSALIFGGTIAGASAETAPPTRTPIDGYKPADPSPYVGAVQVCIAKKTKAKRHGHKARVRIIWKCYTTS